MLTGDATELPASLAGLSTVGVLRHERADTIDDWIDASVAAGLIAVSSDKYRTLALTPLGREVMSGRAPRVRIASPLRPARLAMARALAGRSRRWEWRDDD
jgi:hypothetical protein